MTSPIVSHSSLTSSLRSSSRLGSWASSSEVNIRLRTTTRENLAAAAAAAFELSSSDDQSSSFLRTGSQGL